MGTDIEFFVERRSAGRWELALDYERDAPPWLQGRPYGLYAVLSGIRRPSRHFEPIAPARGFPADLSPELARIVQEYEYRPPGDHGASWLLLDEILRARWDEPFLCEGYVRASDAASFVEPPQPFPVALAETVRPAGMPVEMAEERDVKVRWLEKPPLLLRLLRWAPNRVQVESGFVEPSLAPYFREPPAPYPKDLPATARYPSRKPRYRENVPVRWTETYRDYADYFETYCRDELTRLGSPKDVRAVFWFNS